MSPHNLTAISHRQQLTILQLVLLASFLLLFGIGIVSSTAQSAQDNDVKERRFESALPTHVPLRMKLKNEQVFKNLKNDKWARDFEVEVTNTSDKPIYFLAIGVIMPEVKSDTGHDMGFILRYGRIELVDYTTPLEPNDVPIEPNETYTFKIPEQNLRGWERFTTKRKLPKSEPKRVQLVFSQLNFGDGTGYQGLDAAPVNIHQKQSMNNSCVKDVGDTDRIAMRASPDQFSNLPASSSAYFLPANFLPVKLFLAKNDLPNDAPSSSSDICCPGIPCSHLKTGFYTCFCLGTIITIQHAACTDPAGRCGDVVDVDLPCDDEFGTICKSFLITACPIEPTPMPTPTPTPSPTPSGPPTPCPSPPEADVRGYGIRAIQRA